MRRVGLESRKLKKLHLGKKNKKFLEGQAGRPPLYLPQTLKCKSND
jgi:hypothetical protein